MNQPVARSAPLFNAPNVLTAIRLLLVPVFVIAVLVSGMTHAGWRIAAAGIFLVASLTDLVDGWIARRYGLITGFGKVADPIADKALIGAALVLLAGFGEIWWWVTGLILAREVGVTLLRFWLLRRGHTDRGGSSVIAASLGGKVKTGLQIAAIGWYLLPWPDPLPAVGPWLLAAALVVTVATGLDYVWRAVRDRGTTGNGR